MDLSRLPPDKNRGISSLTVHAVLTFLALAVVALRSIAGMKTPDGLKADDYTMLLGMLISVVNLGFTIAGTIFGQGRHIVRLEPENAVKAIKTMFAIEFLLPLALAVVKLSVALFLLRLVGSRRWLRRALIANMAFLLASTLAYSIVLWIQCRPLAGNWDPTIMYSACFEPSVLMNTLYVTTAFTILMDFLCALIPIPIIWDLKMDRKTKASVAGLMGLGVFAGACAIVRMTYVSSLRNPRKDPTWILIPLGLWAVIELHVAIIVGSIPPCRALLLRLWSRLCAFSVKSEGSSHDDLFERPSSLAPKISLPFSRESWMLMGQNNHYTQSAGFCALELTDEHKNRGLPTPVDSSRVADGHTGGIVKTSNFTVTSISADERGLAQAMSDMNDDWKWDFTTNARMI